MSFFVQADPQQDSWIKPSTSDLPKEFPKPMIFYGGEISSELDRSVNFADWVVNSWDSLLWKESHMKGVDLEYSTHQWKFNWVSIGLWIHHKKKQPATESPSVSCMRLLNIFTCAERIGSLLS